MRAFLKPTPSLVRAFLTTKLLQYPNQYCALYPYYLIKQPLTTTTLALSLLLLFIDPDANHNKKKVNYKLCEQLSETPPTIYITNPHHAVKTHSLFRQVLR